MNSNRLSKLALQDEVIQIARAYLFLCNSEQTHHEKKEIGSAAEENMGRARTQAQQGQLEEILLQTVYSLKNVCVGHQ